MSLRQAYKRKKGFHRAGSLVEGRLRAAGESRGFAVTRLLTHWSDIVGADVASMSSPVKVSYAKGGFGATLILLVKGAQAQIVEMQLPAILEKVNACYGYKAIARVKLTQTAPTGFREGQAIFQHAPKQSVAKRNPEYASQANNAVSVISDPDLRAALAAFGENVLHGKKEKL